MQLDYILYTTYFLFLFLFLLNNKNIFYILLDSYSNYKIKKEIEKKTYYINNENVSDEIEKDIKYIFDKYSPDIDEYNNTIAHYMIIAPFFLISIFLNFFIISIDKNMYILNMILFIIFYIYIQSPMFYLYLKKFKKISYGLYIILFFIMNLFCIYYINGSNYFMEIKKIVGI